MTYFYINESLDSKIIGQYSQVEKAIYHCDIWEDPKFIDRSNFIKIDFEPITANAVLVEKAKLTDLISADILGFSLKLLISGKLKSILEKSRASGLQFYKSPIIYKKKEIEDYWILNPYEFDMELIDFIKSDVFLMKNTFEKVEKLSIKSFRDFMDNKEKISKMGYPYSIYIENINLTDTINQDFFILKDVENGIKYVVSEKLKKEIENANCTGIEFMPSDLSLNEWLAKDGERERIYGKV